MRTLNLSDIQRKMEAKAQLVNHKVQIFRGKSKEQGWTLKRTRPRNSDEIKALNYIHRKSLRTALKEGSICYDKERRVMIFAKYSRS